MKFLKYGLYVIGSFVAIVLLAAAVVKKQYHVEKTIIIEQPVDSVYGYLKYLKNQDQFSKWAKMDPKVVNTYRGTDATVGFVNHWESEMEEVGIGEQEIKSMDEGKRIEYELRFIEPFQSVEKAYIQTEAINPSSTKVTWGFDGHMDYPFNLLIPLMKFETMIGNDLQEGLNNLKNILDA